MIEHVREWADEHGFELAAGRRPEPRDPRAGDARAARTRRRSCSRATWTSSASAIRRARTTRRKGRIALVRDGEWLTADGTTLGADDGVAIAAMMALVEDESLPHGPLELLMTVAEEVGLEGANALDGSLLVTGSILINLDSEEDGALTVGCAGSTDTWIRIDAPRERRAADGAVTLVGRGRAAGWAATRASRSRSGTSNAIKVLGRVLREAYASGAVPARLARRRQEPQRDPARRDRRLLGSGDQESGVPGRGRVGDRGRSATPSRRRTPACRP